MAVLSATFFRNDDEDDLLQQKLLKTKLYMAHLRGGVVDVDRHSIGTPS